MRSLLIFFTALAAAALADAPSPGQLRFFEEKVRPIFLDECYKCHSEKSEKLKGGLRLDTRDGWQRGGDSGKAVIVPGDPDASMLIAAVRRGDPDTAMPPKTALHPAKVAALEAWVKMGAPDPRDDSTAVAKRADKSWWSLQPLAKVDPPSPAGLPEAWAQNPIDRFVFAKLAEKKLEPSPPADPRTLIRRMTYDVLGLPPTPEEVEAFAQSAIRDPQSAIESLADRLLASPRYGEQWGRHWLDVARFGESNGFERNVIIEDLWPYRDYVIRSFNDDKPFSQFVVEQLAGDVIAKGNPEIEVGTAFLVAGPYDNVGNQDPVAAANIRAATLDDPITTTATAFLGLTINCARCHNHKFDPIPTEDYYRLRAAFEGVAHGQRVLATEEEREKFAAAMKPLHKRKSKLSAEKDAIEKPLDQRAKDAAAKRTYARPKPGSDFTEERFAAVEARHLKFVMLADTVSAKSPGLARLDEFEVWSADDPSRNVALASYGAKAQGASARQADDFAGAYDIRHVNDGKFGSRWLAAEPFELTLTFAKAERIDRVTFSHTRGSTTLSGLGAFPCEYEVQISPDGKTWSTVASSADREPWSAAHGIERVRREIITPEERRRLAELDRDIAAVDRQTAAVPPLRQAWAGKFAQPGERTFVQKGGDPMKPGDPVAPASLSVLDRVTKSYELKPAAAEGERRLALAKWIASDDNPLTARVLANRVWHYHFGIGIVDTPSDFGFLGSQPTHPELLDWLALRLQQHGWKLKALHREILLSQTYRQASQDGETRRQGDKETRETKTAHPSSSLLVSLSSHLPASKSSPAFEQGTKLDKEARYLWRFPPRRLRAEEIRDTTLMIAGKLDLMMGGPGFRLYRYSNDNVSTFFPLDQCGPETYRRAVYHQSARASTVDVLSDFDLPDNAFPVPRRASTTSPLQALTMLNHSFTLDMAAALAARVEREAGADIAAQVDRACALAFQHAPSATERDAAVKLIQSTGLRAFCRALLNANELIYLE